MNKYIKIKQKILLLSLAFSFSNLYAANQTVVDSLNANIKSNPEYLDYLIQDVCVDSSDSVISGDPSACSSHRNVRIGEKVPYILSDKDVANGGVLYQGLFSYPVPGVDNKLKVLVSKLSTVNEMITWGSGYVFNEKNDGYDLLDVSSPYVSGIRTSDGGCYDQKISQDISKRENGWIFYPVSGLSTTGSIVNPIRIERLNNPTCEKFGIGNPHSIWDSPIPVTFESGKNLKTLQTYHVATSDLTVSNNAIEKYFFTKEYGFTRWEAWIPYSRCIKDYPSDSAHRCEPNHANNFLKGRCNPATASATWGNQTWIRVDCRDSTNYSVLPNAIVPTNSSIATANGLVDIDSNFKVVEQIKSGTWSYPSSCPTSCGSPSSVQTSVCMGGNGICSGSATTRMCGATSACLPATVFDFGKDTETSPGDLTVPSFTLKVGEELKAGNNRKLVFQTDGNLALYDTSSLPITSLNASWYAVNWSTDCKYATCIASLQTDGNLVLYRNNVPYWASNTDRNPGSVLVFSNQKPYVKIKNASGSVIKDGSTMGIINAWYPLSGKVLGDFASNVTCLDIPRNLIRGTESSYVTKLQSFLSQKGFLTETPSGFYGENTVEAVKDYQISKGLPSTGMLYNFTRAVIKEETCK